MTKTEVAGVYDARARNAFDGSTILAEVAAAMQLFEQLVPSPDACILDVGCGAGWHLAAMSTAGYVRTYGLDISIESLRVAAGNCASYDTVFINGDIGEWSAPAFFDVLTAFNSSVGSFGEVEDTGYLAGAHASLKPGGLLLLTFASAEVAHCRVGDFRVRYSASANADVISKVRIHEEAGWLVIDQETGGSPIPQERIRLYDYASLCSILRSLDFDVIPLSLESISLPALRFVNVVAAVKRQ